MYISKIRSDFSTGFIIHIKHQNIYLLNDIIKYIKNHFTLNLLSLDLLFYNNIAIMGFTMTTFIIELLRLNGCGYRISG